MENYFIGSGLFLLLASFFLNKKMGWFETIIAAIGGINLLYGMHLAKMIDLGFMGL